MVITELVNRGNNVYFKQAHFTTMLHVLWCFYVYFVSEGRWRELIVEVISDQETRQNIIMPKNAYFHTGHPSFTVCTG